LQWARTHKGWSILGSPAKTARQPMAPNPALPSPAGSRQFNSVVGALPTLPTIKIPPLTGYAAILTPRPTPREKSAAPAVPEDQRAAPLPVAKPNPVQPTARQSAMQSAPRTSIVDTRETVLKLEVVKGQPVLLGEAMHASSYQPAFKSSIISEPLTGMQSALQTMHEWSIFGHFQSSRSPLTEPRNLPVSIIILLSGFSAYVFVRFTSMRCPQCRKLLERRSLACRSCGLDFSAAKV
jgi:hypothetical protein